MSSYPPLQYPAGTSKSHMRPRKPSGSPLSYERPSPISPPPRRFSNPYEEYGPPRATPLYRDTRDRDAYYPRGANSYRPLDYYPRSPSPERRPEPPARSEPATWDRPADNGWQSKTTWDRRSLTRSPTSPVIIRPRMLSDAGSRMFEPSDAWKQSERERSASLQSPRISGPLFDRGPSPERLLRSPALSRGDGRGDSFRLDQKPRSAGRFNKKRQKGYFRPKQRYRASSPPISRRFSPSPSPTRSPAPTRPRSRPRSRSRSDRSRSRSRSRMRSYSRSRSRMRSYSRSRSRIRSYSRSRSRMRSYSRSRSRSRTWSSSPRRRARSRSRSRSISRSRSPRARGRRSRSRSTTRSSIASTQASNHAPSRRASPVPPPAPQLPETVASPLVDSVLPAPAPQPLRASLSVEIPIPGFGNPHLSDPKEANESPHSHEEELPVSPTSLPDPDHSGDAWKLLDCANSSQSSAQTTPPIPNQNAELTVPTPAKAVDVDSSEKSMSDPSASASEAEPPSVDGPKVQPNGVDTPFTVEVVETVPTPAKVVPIKLLPPPLPRIPRSRTGFSLDAIPPLKDAKNIADALRTVVMTRLRDDDQTREARVEPVLQENLLFTQDEDAYPPSTKTQEQLVASISRVRFDPPRDDVFVAAKPWLLQRFRKRTDQLEVKRKELEKEYQGLHTQWRRHCDILDQQGRPMEPPGIGGAGDALPSRTTRRSAALGDTVRSDLEMEQIIASLGYDEAMDPNSLASRNLATIPDMISTTSATPFVYDDTNHRVDNPHEYYAPSTGIHDWTTSEKEVFLDAYARTPKQFGLIADQLPNKNAAQCVDYYYLHKKKIIDFRKVVAQYAPRRGRGRGGRGRGRGGGLLADIRQHDAEVYGDDDEYVARGARTARGGAPGAGTEGRRPPSTRRSSAFGLDYVETATPTPEPEEADGVDGRPKRRRVSAITRVAYVADEPEEPEAEPKKRKRGRPPKQRPPPVVLEPSPVPTPPVPDVEPQSSFSQASMLWSLEDKALLLGLAKQHGPNFSRIAMMMPNKTTAQVAEYYQMLDVGKMLNDAVRKGIDDGRLGAGRALGSASGSGTSTPVTGETSTSAVPARSAGTIIIPAQLPRADSAGVPTSRIGVMAAKPDP